MKVKLVHVSYGRTINLGNYESLKLEFGVDVELEKDQAPETALHDLRHYLREQVKAGALEEIKMRRESTRGGAGAKSANVKSAGPSTVKPVVRRTLAQAPNPVTNDPNAQPTKPRLTDRR